MRWARRKSHHHRSPLSSIPPKSHLLNMASPPLFPLVFNRNLRPTLVHPPLTSIPSTLPLHERFNDKLRGYAIGARESLRFMHELRQDLMALEATDIDRADAMVARLAEEEMYLKGKIVSAVVHLILSFIHTTTYDQKGAADLLKTYRMVHTGQKLKVSPILLSGMRCLINNPDGEWHEISEDDPCAVETQYYSLERDTNDDHTSLREYPPPMQHLRRRTTYFPNTCTVYAGPPPIQDAGVPSQAYAVQDPDMSLFSPLAMPGVQSQVEDPRFLRSGVPQWPDSQSPPAMPHFPPPGVVMSQRSPTSGAEVIPGGSFWMGDGVRPRELEVQQSSPDPQECFGPQLNFDVSSGEGVSRHIDMLSRIKANADPESMGRPENHPMEFTGSVHTMSFASSPVAPHTHPAVEVHSQRKKRERVSGSDPRSVSALLATPACAIISLLLAGAETRQSKAETRG